jgi:hypothetical protein
MMVLPLSNQIRKAAIEHKYSISKIGAGCNPHTMQGVHKNIAYIIL